MKTPTLMTKSQPTIACLVQVNWCVYIYSFPFDDFVDTPFYQQPRTTAVPAVPLAISHEEAPDEDDDELAAAALGAPEKTYCYCQGPSYGEMIGCDNADCLREWFHLDCLGLKTAPSGTWYCVRVFLACTNPAFMFYFVSRKSAKPLSETMVAEPPDAELQARCGTQHDISQTILLHGHNRNDKSTEHARTT